MVGTRDQAIGVEHFGGRGGGSIAFNNPFSKLSLDTFISKLTPNTATMLNNKKNWESTIDKVSDRVDKAQGEKEKEKTQEQLLQEEREKKRTGENG